MCEDKSFFTFSIVMCFELQFQHVSKTRHAKFALQYISLRGWNQSCCFCVVSRLEFFYSGPYFFSVDPFWKTKVCDQHICRYGFGTTRLVYTFWRLCSIEKKFTKM